MAQSVSHCAGEIRSHHVETRSRRAVAELAEEEGLTPTDVQMLASINYRGERPKTKEDWRFLWQSIRRSVRHRIDYRLRHGKHQKYWESLEALSLAKAIGIDDPVEAMKVRARDLIQKGELDAPPTNLDLLASIQDVLSITPVPMKEAGRLVPTPDGLVIQVNAEDVPRRQNFTIAHELGHTLLPTYSRRPAYRVDTTVGSFPRNQEEEYLCDVAASALLFPEEWLQARAVARDPDLSAVFDLADEFQGSLEATALAWAKLDLWPCAIAIWKRELKPSEIRRFTRGGGKSLETGTPEPKFRLARFYPSNRFSHFLPKYKSVGDDSIVGQAATWGSASGQLVIELGDAPLTLKCEAKFAPYKQDGAEVERVISLLWPL